MGIFSKLMDIFSSKEHPKTSVPEPETPAPEPETPAPEPQTPAPEQQTPAPELQTPAPGLETPAPEPQSPAPGPKPWRRVYKNNFEMAETHLKEQLREHRHIPLNIVLIGHTGAGKSSLINSIFSLSRGRIVDKTVTKPEEIPGVGTSNFLKFKSKQTDLFDSICIFDTMGFTGEIGRGQGGIKDKDLKAVCLGRIQDKHMFNGVAKAGSVIKENIPDCVMLVVSAKELDRPFPDGGTNMHQRLKTVSNIVTNDSAKIVVITNIDRAYGDTHSGPINIYTSEAVHRLVAKAQSIFGVDENHVFPIVNLVTGIELDNAELNVPLLYALTFALHYALDRKEVRYTYDKMLLPFSVL